MRRQILILSTLSSLAGLSAQERPLLPNAERDPVSGMGRVTFGPLALDALTGQIAALGCAYLNGEIYVSSRGNAQAFSAPHTCFVLDTSGAIVRTFQQNGTLQSTWGWNDGASDGVGTLVFGFERAVEFVDANGAPATRIQATNGTQMLPGSVLTPRYTRGTIGTLRAIAYNPDGDGGNGSVFAADFGSDIVEFRVSDGLEINRIAHDLRWSLSGLARHPVTGNLWANGSPSGSRGSIIEIDVATGLPTGEEIGRAAGFEGGLEIVPGGLDGRASGYDLLALVQEQPDLLTGHRLDLYGTIRGTSEVELRSGFDGGTLGLAGIQTMSSAKTTWDLDLDDGALAPRTFDVASIALNLPPFALPDGALNPLIASLFPSLREVRYLDSFTSPTGMALNFPATEAAPRVTFSVPTLLNFADHRQYLRAQALYLDLTVPSGLQVMFTNQVRVGADHSTDVSFPPTTPLGVRVSAFGNQSYNSITSSGFWRVENTGSFDLLKVMLTLPATMDWDEDQVGMADALINGNGVRPGCSGTYRNASDVTTGLIYGVTPGNTCSATARRGYTISDDASTLTFVFENGGFTNGELFEFDADTDGGGVTADAHAGTDVAVWVRDPTTGTVLRSRSSLLVVSTTDPIQEAAVVF